MKITLNTPTAADELTRRVLICGSSVPFGGISPRLVIETHNPWMLHFTNGDIAFDDTITVDCGFVGYVSVSRWRDGNRIDEDEIRLPKDDFMASLGVDGIELQS